MLRDIEKSNLNTEGLFLNADAGFDSQKFRDLCSANEIIENIPANKRNGSPSYSINVGLLLKEPMLGWMLLKLFSYGLKPRKYTGKNSIYWLFPLS